MPHRSRALLRASRRQRVIAVCTVLLLLCTFEVTTRLVPPDGMTETVTSVGLQTSTTEAAFTEPRDTTTITHVDTALNNGAITWPIPGLFCHSNEWFTTTITLTWHGLPTQSWYQEACSDWSRTSGGLPDLWDRAPTVKLGV
jgi:hypothetical protein